MSRRFNPGPDHFYISPAETSVYVTCRRSAVRLISQGAKWDISSGHCHLPITHNSDGLTIIDASLATQAEDSIRGGHGCKSIAFMPRRPRSCGAGTPKH